MRALVVVLLSIAGALAGAAPAHADPPCAEHNVCQYQPDPQWNGQQQQTWEVPPYTWPRGELQCNPYTTTCYPVAHP